MELTNNTIKMIVDELDNYIFRHQEELERVLHKVDGVDRRIKLKRKGIVSKIPRIRRKTVAKDDNRIL